MEKNPHLYVIKSLDKLGTEGDFFNLIRNLHTQKLTSDLKMKRLKVFSQDDKKGCSLLKGLFNIVLKVLAKMIRQENERKGIGLERKK